MLHWRMDTSMTDGRRLYPSSLKKSQDSFSLKSSGPCIYSKHITTGSLALYLDVAWFTAQKSRSNHQIAMGCMRPGRSTEQPDLHTRQCPMKSPGWQGHHLEFLTRMPKSVKIELSWCWCSCWCAKSTVYHSLHVHDGCNGAPCRKLLDQNWLWHLWRHLLV